MKILQSLPAAEMISTSVHNILPPPATTHRDDPSTNVRQEESNRINLTEQTTHPVRELNCWYDTDYYNNLS